VVLSLILLGLAIATFRLLRWFDDDVLQLAVLLTSTTLLLIALMTSHWIALSIVLMTILPMLRKLRQQTQS
jgi:hypothetical protein